MGQGAVRVRGQGGLRVGHEGLGAGISVRGQGGVRVGEGVRVGDEGLGAGMRVRGQGGVRIAGFRVTVKVRGRAGRGKKESRREGGRARV